MSKLFRYVTLWLYGGFVYYVIELIWRGYSHPSMFVLGGLCLVIIGGLNNWFPWELGLLWQSLIGAAVVTIAEYITGLIVNIGLGLNVWDYSALPLNLAGQICALFALLWVPLAIFAIFLDDWIRYWTFDEERPRYKLL
jgi:uncharacterized membrane protein